MAQYLPVSVLHGLKEATNLFDMDKDGYLTFREFRLIMSSFIYDATQEELAKAERICQENPKGISTSEAVDCAARIWLVRNSKEGVSAIIEDDEVTDATPLDLDDIYEEVMQDEGMNQPKKKVPVKSQSGPKKKAGLFNLVSKSEGGDPLEAYLASKKR